MSVTTSNGHEYEPAQSAGELLTTYLMCRTYRHPWDPYTDTQLERPSFGVRLSMLCPRCGMKRHDIRSYRGELLARSYDPPRDYKLSGDVSGQDLWAEVLVRTESGDLVIKAKRVPKRRLAAVPA